jgi:hypothetical protein
VALQNLTITGGSALEAPAFRPFLPKDSLSWTVEATWEELQTGPAEEHCGACGGWVPGGPCGRSIPVGGCGVVTRQRSAAIVVGSSRWDLDKVWKVAEALTDAPHLAWTYPWTACTPPVAES